MPTLTDVKYLDRYKLRLTFENGRKKIVDLENYLEGRLLRPLKDLSNFQAFSLDTKMNAVKWYNDTNINSDFLFLLGEDDRSP